jgi:hypothetical protein
MRLHNLGQVAYVKYEETKMRQELRQRIPRSFVIFVQTFWKIFAFGAKRCWIHFPRLEVGDGADHMTLRGPHDQN